MTKFLRFRNRKRSNSRSTEIVPQRVIYGRRLDQIVGGDFGIPVIFHHAGVEDLWIALPVEVGKIRLLKSLGDFNGSISSEVEEHHAVPVDNRTNRLCPFCNHERIHILVGNLWIFLIVGSNGLRGRGKHPAKTKNMGIPSLLNDSPVGLVAIHGGQHAAAAGGDSAVAAVFLKLVTKFLQRSEILQCTFCSHVPPIKQSMYSYTIDATLSAALENSVEMVYVGVHIAIRNQTDQMKCSTSMTPFLYHRPALTLENCPGVNRLTYQFGSLGKDPSCAKRIMADLRIAHVVIAGQTYCLTVSL